MDRIGTRQDLNWPVTIYPLRHGARLNGTEVIGCYGKGRMLHAAQRIPIGLCLFALRNFEKRTQAIVTHIKKVVTYALVGCITPVLFCSHAFRYLHGTNQRHAQDIHVEIRGQFHVIICESEMVNSPYGAVKPASSECVSLAVSMKILRKFILAI